MAFRCCYLSKETLGKMGGWMGSATPATYAVDLRRALHRGLGVRVVEEAEAGVALRIVVGAHELHLVELGHEPNYPIPHDDMVKSSEGGGPGGEGSEGLGLAEGLVEGGAS